MKKIEQIRNKYDIITEKQDTDARKLEALARSGLFESKKIPVLKRALEKEPEKMTIAERKVVLELLDSLIAEAVYSQNLNEAKEGQYLTKYDPRFDNSAAVSERDLPTIIILKRKGIRVFSGNQKIGLYYSQYLDRYISIPFGPGVPSINEAANYKQAYQDYVKDYGDESDDKKKGPKSPEELRQFVIQKAGEGKIRAKHYSTRPKVLGGDPEKIELKKASNKYLKNKFFGGQITALDALSAKAGVALGSAIRRGVTEPIRDKIRQIRGKTKAAEPTSAPTTEPTSAPKTVSAPKVLTKKQQEVKADVSARMASAKKSAAKAKDPNVPEKSRQMAATRARKIATYAQVSKKKAGLMEKIREVKNREQLDEFAPAVVTGVRLGASMLGKVLARAPKKAPTPAPKPVEVPPVKTPAPKPAETPPAPKPAEVPPAKPAEVPSTPKPAETPPAPKPAETPPAPKPAEAPAPKPAEAPAPKPSNPKPAETTPAPKGGSTAPKKPSLLRRFGKGIALGAAGALLGGSSDQEKEPKYLDPAKFGLKITTNKPEAQVTTGVDKRQSNLYRKALEAPVNEEKDEDKAKLKPASFSMKVKTSTPKSKVKTGVEARMQKYERDYYTQQNESILKSMKNMISEGTTEMQLNIGENSITINNTIAQKIVSVHESLNKDNKKQMENMLSESVESFKKIVNFAVRQ